MTRETPQEWIERHRARGLIEELAHEEMERTGIYALQGLADGLGLDEVAEALGRQHTYVRQMLARLYPRLGAREKSHAVAIALRKGWIS